MATSSIWAYFSIENQKTADKFVEVLERSASDSKRTPTSSNSAHISDKDKILKLLQKGIHPL